MAERTYEPTNVYDELFSNEFDTTWIVKGDRAPTAAAACAIVTEVSGEPLDGQPDECCRLRRARIEWRDVEGWWLTRDDDGPYEVWEVSGA